MRGERGSVLIHVLITAVVVSLIAAGLLKMVLMRYQAGNRQAQSASNRKSAEGAYTRMLSAWNRANTFCQNFAEGGGVDYSCAGPAACAANACTCTPANAADPIITVRKPPGSVCTVTVTTP